MNVLIVDDSAAMRMMIIKTLRQAGLNGHNFAQAPDGAAALEAIRKAQPDVVLCDWNMPNMTGIDLLTALRGEGIRVEFGFITTETTTEMRQKAAAAAKDAPTDWVAVYVDDAGTPVAACACSKEFVAYAGSALMMMPPAAAKQAAASGAVDETLASSFHEIMNICSRFLMSDHTPHLRLATVSRRGAAQGLAAIAPAATRKDFAAAIPRYGAGQLACLVT